MSDFSLGTILPLELAFLDHRKPFDFLEDELANGHAFTQDEGDRAEVDDFERDRSI
jgi:hypothetical protein